MMSLQEGTTVTTPITESALYLTIHRQPADWRRLLAREASPIAAAAALYLRSPLSSGATR
jgi:hypothetical protein